MSSTSVNLSAGGVAAVAGIVIAGGAAWFLYDWLKKNKDKFNPTSTNNAAYQAVNTIYRAVTGSVDSIGTAAYDAVNKGTDPTKFTQAELERITAAGNHYGRGVDGWIVG